MRNNAHGFSLIELLVVVVMTGIMATVAGASIAGQVQRQNLGLAQQNIAQSIRNARQLAISKSRSMTIQFFPAPDNKIRIYENDNDDTNDDNNDEVEWNAATLKQEQNLPNNINLQTNGVVPFRTKFNFRGEISNVGQLRTVYLTADNTNYLDSDAGRTACETAQTCKAVVISTVLGKVRTVK